MSFFIIKDFGNGYTSSTEVNVNKECAIGMFNDTISSLECTSGDVHTVQLLGSSPRVVIFQWEQDKGVTVEDGMTAAEKAAMDKYMDRLAKEDAKKDDLLAFYHSGGATKRLEPIKRDTDPPVSLERYRPG